MDHLIKIGVTCAMGAPASAPFPIHTDDFCATADWLADNGFDTMEVHIRAPELVDGAKLAAHCARRGIAASSIGTGMAYGAEGLNMTSADAAVRKAALQRLKDQMDLGATLRCPVIIGSMRGMIGPVETFADVDARMVDGMKELADYAETTDTELVIEAINRFETNYLKTAQDVLELIDRVGSVRVKVHLDTYHMNLEERSFRAAILSCAGKLGHVHVADNMRSYPGAGMIDFREIISALLEIGYTRSLTMECNPGADGRETVRRGLRHLTAVMAAYGGL